MSNHKHLTAEQIAGLTLDTEPYLSCDDCFDQVDGFVEALLSSSGNFSEPFRVHLLACPACHEEALALAALAGPEYGLSEQQALEKITTALGGAAA